MLAFGPDGYLWIGTGDGGAANDRFGNGQNPATLLGKMLRIDVTSDGEDPYVIPADNPWVTADWNGQDVRDEVWAVGLRNPWRYSFDRQTGDLWIADVGQNLIEEINFVPAADVQAGGLNFGWPIMEGKSCFQSANLRPKRSRAARHRLPARGQLLGHRRLCLSRQRTAGLERRLFLRRLLQRAPVGAGS